MPVMNTLVIRRPPRRIRIMAMYRQREACMDSTARDADIIACSWGELKDRAAAQSAGERSTDSLHLRAALTQQMLQVSKSSISVGLRMRDHSMCLQDELRKCKHSLF